MSESPLDKLTDYLAVLSEWVAGWLAGWLLWLVTDLA